MAKKPTKPAPPSPWAVPLFPADGDADINTTYASVGRALSYWERFEEQLAGVYARLIGPGGITRAAERAYGAIRTFEGRTEMLYAAGAAFFDFFAGTGAMKASVDALESDLRSLLNTARNHASNRRNEIAHGIVRSYDTFIPEQVKGFVLGPPEYMIGKRPLADIDIPTATFAPGVTGRAVIKTTRPNYLYSSVEIDRFGKQFMELVPPAADIANRLQRRVTPR